MKEAYQQAYESGFYAKPTGLQGKYDNTRRYWEDAIIAMNLRPYITRMLNEKEKLNILDIGCGGGDGYELLKSAIKRDPPLEQHEVSLLPSHLFSPLREFFLDYRISYLYSEEEREQVDVDSFPLRLVTPEEITVLVNRVKEKSTKKIDIVHMYDRSMLIGRHIDTGEYNPGPQFIRKKANRLHEDYIRTNTESLYFNYYPKKNFPKQNRHYRNLERCWNAVIGYFNARIRERINPVNYDEWHDYPPVVQQALMTIDRVVDSVAWMEYGDPRANIIEPQLGYALRNLEIKLSAGRGYGHSFVVVIEIKE